MLFDCCLFCASFLKISWNHAIWLLFILCLLLKDFMKSCCLIVVYSAPPSQRFHEIMLFDCCFFCASFSKISWNHAIWLLFILCLLLKDFMKSCYLIVFYSAPPSQRFHEIMLFDCCLFCASFSKISWNHAIWLLFILCLLLKDFMKSFCLIVVYSVPPSQRFHEIMLFDCCHSVPASQRLDEIMLFDCCLFCAAGSTLAASGLKTQWREWARSRSQSMCPQGDVSTNLNSIQEILALCIEYVPPRGCEYKSLTRNLSIMYRVCAPEGMWVQISYKKS